MATLKGAPELKARLRAIGQAFKPLGREWGNDATQRLVRYTPRKTGRTAASYRVRNASTRRATVVGSFVAVILDVGQKEHAITPRNAHALRFLDSGGRPQFTKRATHPRVAPLGFRGRAAREALHENSPLEAVIKQWNEAAR